MEILASELRIGNWFQQDASNNNTISRFFTVDEIKRYGVRSTYIRQDTNQPHTSLFSLDSIHPIPLTPEILEKCGFEWSIYHQAWHKQGFVFDLSERSVGGFFMHKSRLNSEIICPEIQHLHQLQNLYFALTGEELNYKP